MMRSDAPRRGRRAQRALAASRAASCAPPLPSGSNPPRLIFFVKRAPARFTKQAALGKNATARAGCGLPLFRRALSYCSSRGFFVDDQHGDALVRVRDAACPISTG